MTTDSLLLYIIVILFIPGSELSLPVSNFLTSTYDICTVSERMTAKTLLSLFLFWRKSSTYE